MRCIFFGNPIKLNQYSVHAHLVLFLCCLVKENSTVYTKFLLASLKHLLVTILELFGFPLCYWSISSNVHPSLDVGKMWKKLQKLYMSYAASCMIFQKQM
jgi:hypothetical protein